MFIDLRPFRRRELYLDEACKACAWVGREAGHVVIVKRWRLCGHHKRALKALLEANQEQSFDVLLYWMQFCQIQDAKNQAF